MSIISKLFDENDKSCKVQITFCQWQHCLFISVTSRANNLTNKPLDKWTFCCDKHIHFDKVTAHEYVKQCLTNTVLLWLERWWQLSLYWMPQSMNADTQVNDDAPCGHCYIAHSLQILKRIKCKGLDFCDDFMIMVPVLLTLLRRYNKFKDHLPDSKRLHVTNVTTHVLQL